jgi:hypothetical protein
MKGVKQINPLVIENPQYSLSNVENYKKNIHYSIQEILTKFVSVVIEYMKFMSEKIKMKNKTYYQFIFERGVETVIHVFTNILFYTKNLDLAFYHSQKAYYFYIEFIEQISDENVTFLQLSSRDAILFVYKKTIFEINQEYKKTMADLSSDDKIIMSTIESYIFIYKNIIRYIISFLDFNYTNNMNYIEKYCDELKSLTDDFNKLKSKRTQLECIYLFTNLLVDKQIKLSVFLNLISEFTKRLQIRKKIDETNVYKNMLLDLNFDDQSLTSLLDTIFTN